MTPDSELRQQHAAVSANGESGVFRRPAVVDIKTATWIAVAGIVLVLATHFRTVASMVTKWADTETYQHGFLIVPIVLYLVWRKRRDVAEVRPHPDIFGWSALLACGLAWVLGYLGRVHVVQQYALVAMIPAIVWSVMGYGVLRKLKFPLAYLFFAVPAGDVFIPHLMNFTAHFTVWALRESGIPVYSDGYTFAVPAGNFIIARACSGIRYLIASLALGCLYAYLTYVSNWRRVFFVALSALVPILANGLRAYGIVMIAELVDVKYAHGIDHIIYGWVFFGFVMLLMFWAGNYFRDDVIHQDTAPSATEGPGSVVSENRGSALPYFLSVAFASVMVIVFLQVAAYKLNRHSEQAETGLAPLLARGVGGWTGPARVTDVWKPAFHHADKKVAGGYRKDAKQVEVHADYYSRRPGGAEAVAWGNAIVDEKHWYLSTSRARVVALPGLRDLDVIESRIFSHGHGRRLVWQWYDVGGYQTASPVKDKFLEAWQALRGKAAGTLIITLSAPYAEHPETARRALAEYLKANFSALNRCLSEPDHDAGSCGT